MRTTHFASISAIAIFQLVTSAPADTLIHITGSTTFRKATVTAIKNVMGGSGNFKAAYDSRDSGGNGESGANYVILQGIVAAVPSAGLVTVKCSWVGSTGGVRMLVQNLNIPNKGWMSISNLPTTNTIVPVGNPSYSLDITNFPNENYLADIAMSECSQASTGFNTPTLTENRVAVVPFEWVANNGSPQITLLTMTPLLAQALLSGGMPLSQFTRDPADSGVTVYALGRDFNSGTRLSCLAEVGIPFRGSVQHIQPQITGTAGASDSSVNALKLWPAATVLGENFPIGASGFASGGTLADILATPNSSTAATPSGADGVQFGPGWLVAYLGRDDAARACKTTNISNNTAHRMRWNGYTDWEGGIQSNGYPNTYKDVSIQEGAYTAWEYEYLYYRSNYSGNGKLIADTISSQLLLNTPSPTGIKLSTMNVSRPVEGGLVTYGNPY